MAIIIRSIIIMFQWLLTYKCQYFVNKKNAWISYKPTTIVPGQDASGSWDGGLHARYIWSISPNPNLSVAVSKCCFLWLIYGVRQNFYVFSHYCNPDLDDRIYDSLLTSMAAVQV